MKIGLVGHKLIIDEPAGVEKYIYQIFNGLASIDKQNNYTVYFTKEPKKDYWEKLSNGNKNFKYKVVKNFKGPFKSWVQLSLALELYVNPRDVVFYPSDTISGLLNILSPKKFNAVCMLHDLGYKETNEYKNPVIKWLHHYTIEFMLKNSRKLIVPSNDVKAKILKIYPTLKKKIENKITVIPEGLNDNFINSDKITLKQRKDIREKFKLDGHQYLYFISTIQPRKNIPLMIEAFSEVIKENPNYKDVLLILSGKFGWFYEEAVNAPEKFGIKNNVKFLQRTSDEDAAILMKEATSFISCSLEEGFGLPVLEAMACEKPLIISNIPVYKELVGENAIYVNPKNKDSIKAGILEILCDTNQDERIKAAKELSKEFTWEKTAEKTLSVLKSAA